MDLSKISTDELIALKNGDLSKVSTETLMMVKQSIAPEGPTQSGQLKRATGLAARDTVMGLAGLPLMVGDALNAGVNLGIGGINKLTGAQIPMLGSATGAAEQLLDTAGLPRAQEGAEGGVSAVQRAVAGVAGGKGIADIAARALPLAGKATQSVLGAFSDKLGTQAAGASAAALTTDAARQAGVENPYGLLALGMVGGTVPSVSGTVASQGVRAAVQPFSQAGREAIVGKVLRQASANPDAAVANLERNAKSIVPGSVPMTAGASRDVGLAGIESAVRGLDTTNRFAQRIGANNVARMSELDRIAADQAKLEGAKAKRSEVTTPMREQAFSGAGAVDDLSIMQNIDLMQSGSNRQIIKQALDEARKMVNGAKGDPMRLYDARKDIQLLQIGKFDKDGSQFSLAKKELGNVVSLIDKELERAAPGFGAYVDKFRKMSGPVDQMKLLQGIRDKVATGPTDLATGGDVIKAQTLRNQVAARSADIKATLSPTQQKVVDKLIADIDMGLASSAPGMKSPGSDTFKNMSMGNFIGRIFSQDMANNTTLRTMTRPLDWLYNFPDQAITDLLVESMLDPALARQLIGKANMLKVEPVSRQLKDKAAQLGYGALIGSTGE